MAQIIAVAASLDMATASSKHHDLRSNLVYAFRDCWTSSECRYSQGVLFGFSIGMNLTTSLFLGEAPPVGYGFKQDTIAAIYATPIVREIFYRI